MVPSIVLAESGLVGELYMPPGAPRVCVIALSGSGGGLSHRPTAVAIAQAGFPALALAYFGHANLPRRLANIPLEYFARVVEWIRAQPALADAQLVVMGTSRGAELALQLASMYETFAACIATSPSSVRWGGVGQDVPAWIFGGEPLPRMQHRPDAPAPRDIEWEGQRYHVHRDGFLHDLADAAAAEAAAIAVERIAGHVLLFAGEADDLWPSALFAERIVTRMRQRVGSEHTVTVVTYPDVGHVIPLPGEPPVLRVRIPGAPVGMSYGGDVSATMHAAPDRFSRIVGLLGKLGE
jgi:pimeloyl-ACP methyl ester carboxylesterase